MNQDDNRRARWGPTQAAPPPSGHQGHGTGVHEPGALGGDAAARTTGRSVLGGGIWHVASSLLPQGFTLIISIVAARALGPDGMGRQSFISFIHISTMMLFSGGLAVSLMRFIGESAGRGDNAAIHWLVSFARRIQAAAAIVGAVILVVTGIARDNLVEAWMLAALACALGVLHTIPTAVLIGLQRWREASIVGLVTGFVSTVATVVVLRAGGGITGMFAVVAAVSAANLVWTSVLAGRVLETIPTRGPVPPDLRRKVVRFALWSTLDTGLTFVVWMRSEFFFLEVYSTAEQLALYSVTFATVGAVARLPEALSGATSPAFATLHGAGSRERVASGFARGQRLMLLLVAPLTAGLLAVGPELLHLLYGEEYVGTHDVLFAMLIAFPLLPLAELSGSLLSGLGEIRVPVAVAAVAAVVNVSLDFALIPSHEAVGAGLANSGAQLVAAVIITAYACRRVDTMPWDLRTTAAVAVAGFATWGAATAVATALEGFPALAAATVAGAIAFVAATRLLGALRPDDAEWLVGAVGERLNGFGGRAVAVLVKRR